MIGRSASNSLLATQRWSRLRPILVTLGLMLSTDTSPVLARRSRLVLCSVIGVQAAALLFASAAITIPLRPALAATECANPAKAVGVSRVIEIDTSNGPLFGHATHFSKEPSFLAPKEVVLTFDDGPVPWITRSILATLSQHCTRASFFPVGRMALAYPAVVREVIAHGHTVGSHSWSHPLRMPRMKAAAAKLEIDKGFAAVALAAGRPIAPFFRFPGLNDSPMLLAHLAERQAGTFSVDVISDDSFIDDSAKIVRLTLERLNARGGGILLFHDIKPATARALPDLLDQLKARGYRVVHLVAKRPYIPPDTFEAELKGRLGKAIRHDPGVAAAEPESGLAHPLDALKSKVPFFGAIPALVIANPGTPVTALASPRREHASTISDRKSLPSEKSKPSPRPAKPVAAPSPPAKPAVSGWTATATQERRLP